MAFSTGAAESDAAPILLTTSLTGVEGFFGVFTRVPNLDTFLSACHLRARSLRECSEGDLLLALNAASTLRGRESDPKDIEDSGEILGGLVELSDNSRSASKLSLLGGSAGAGDELARPPNEQDGLSSSLGSLNCKCISGCSLTGFLGTGSDGVANFSL